MLHTSHSLTLTSGRVVVVTPPTGVKLVAVQTSFGLRFSHLRDRPPTDAEAQRRVMTKIARALSPYVTGATAAELLEAFAVNPYDMTTLVQAVMGGIAYTSKR